ncbi:AAA family ATPase [Streptomyces acidiscabies]|uniref:AAA family ATPase n=1 Tax=Streptomyces acidiscabies TaxID=42234 RepID=UPI00350E53CA
MRLTSFKSFTGQRLPLQDLTVLIGRNGSGKSNALDALMVLARLASGCGVDPGWGRGVCPVGGGLVPGRVPGAAGGGRVRSGCRGRGAA